MYEIDGVVIKVNDFSLYKKLGFTAHHPRWAMAFKFEARQGTTKLTDVHFTGELKKYGRDEARSIVEHLGGRTVGNISSKVNYLVTGKDPGSKLEQASKKDTLKIIDEKKFLQLIGKKQYA